MSQQSKDSYVIINKKYVYLFLFLILSYSTNYRNYSQQFLIGQYSKNNNRTIGAQKVEKSIIPFTFSLWNNFFCCTLLY